MRSRSKAARARWGRRVTEPKPPRFLYAERIEVRWDAPNVMVKANGPVFLMRLKALDAYLTGGALDRVPSEPYGEEKVVFPLGRENCGVWYLAADDRREGTYRFESFVKRCEWLSLNLERYDAENGASEH